MLYARPVVVPGLLFRSEDHCLCYLLPWALVWLGMMTFDRAYRTQQTHISWLGAVASAWGAWGAIAFVAIGLATAAFAVLERVQTRSHFINEWNPRKLPPVRIPNQIPRTTSIFELAFALLFFVWWALNASSISVARFISNSARSGSGSSRPVSCWPLPMRR